MTIKCKEGGVLVEQGAPCNAVVFVADGSVTKHVMGKRVWAMAEEAAADPLAGNGDEHEPFSSSLPVYTLFPHLIGPPCRYIPSCLI